MPGETISPEHAASFVKSGMWLDYGATHRQRGDGVQYDSGRCRRGDRCLSSEANSQVARQMTKARKNQLCEAFVHNRCRTELLTTSPC